MTPNKPEKWDALIFSFACYLLREPQTVLTNELDENGKRMRVFGFMVEPWSEVRAEIARLRALQVEQREAA